MARALTFVARLRIALGVTFFVKRHERVGEPRYRHSSESPCQLHSSPIRPSDQAL